MHHDGVRGVAVFSAYAEVVPWRTRNSLAIMCILRVRGGSSQAKAAELLKLSYSPRTRR